MEITIDEAIEVLESALQHFNIVGEGNFKDAINLGISALKRIQLQRKKYLPMAYNSLPGETKD